MSSGRAAELQEALALADVTELELQPTVWNNTGYVNVIKVGNHYQARIQVPGAGVVEARSSASEPQTPGP